MQVLDYSYPVVACPECREPVNKYGLASHLKGRRCRYARLRVAAEDRGLAPVHDMGVYPPPKWPAELLHELGIHARVIPYAAHDGIFYKTYAPRWAAAICRAVEDDPLRAELPRMLEHARDNEEYRLAIEAAAMIGRTREFILSQS